MAAPMTIKSPGQAPTPAAPEAEWEVAGETPIDPVNFQRDHHHRRPRLLDELIQLSLHQDRCG